MLNLKIRFMVAPLLACLLTLAWITTAFADTPPAAVTHTVQPGDVLVNLAAQYKTTAEAIMAANGIADPRSLQVGQQLVIPAQETGGNYTIKPGDTLLGLAIAFNVNLDDIQAMNPGVDSSRLQLGQIIHLPAPNTSTPHPVSKSYAAPTVITLPLPVTQTTSLLAGLEQTIAQGVNDQRTQSGLAAYQIDPLLTVIARSHAFDMATGGYLGHVSPNGRTLRDRLEAQGLHPSQSGENYEFNLRSPEQTANYALNWFMNDRPHRANILHDHYTKLGAGVAESGGGYIFVLVFTGE